MCKGTSKTSNGQEKMLFPLPEMISDKKIRVDFNAPDISSNGGLLFVGNMRNTLAWKIGQLIPDTRKQEFVLHTYMEMVSQRIGQILCGYEDANDCNRLRGDSALKMSVGRKPSDADLSSQPTMTRLENGVDGRTLYHIGKLFLDEYISSFGMARRRSSSMPSLNIQLAFTFPKIIRNQAIVYPDCCCGIFIWSAYCLRVNIPEPLLLFIFLSTLFYPNDICLRTYLI